jgi:hypothetical protein
VVAASAPASRSGAATLPEARLVGMSAARLPDIEEIHQLKARYFRALDLRLWDLFADVWTEDARLEEPRGTGVEGRDAIVEYVRASLAPFESVHHGHQPEITFTGEHTATGVWAMSGLIAVPGTDPVKGFTDAGYYTDGYTRDGGVWRISRSRLELLRIDPLPGGLPGS